MNAALEAAARATAAKIHSVPRVTLMYKSSGRLPTECRMGPSTVLTTNEEDLSEKWIISLAKVHHPVNKEQLLDSKKFVLKRSKPDFHSKRKDCELKDRCKLYILTSVDISHLKPRTENDILFLFLMILLILQ
ncbi:hypothetical protein JTB14_023505 [Gonioctena quinquepunctata]|nr:hypothetical protein JTB14_023505 [Gonioctena quinquepunctata]